MTRFGLVFSAALATLACCTGLALSALAPTVRTGRATAVTQQTATLNGSINPHGVPTAYYFAYGRTTKYGRRTNTGDAGSGATRRAVSAALTGLLAHTTYHYRLVGFSSGGTTRGADRTFKTPQIPTTATIFTSHNPVVFGQTVQVTGALSGPNVGGHKVALETKPSPFVGPFTQTGNTVVAGPDGAYGFVFQPLVTSQIRVVDQSKPSITSAILIEDVALRVSVRVRRLRHRKHRVLFRGHVTPARVGNPVLIQRRTRKGWATVAITLTRARTDAHSGFKRSVRLPRRGKYRVLVKTTAGDYADGTSRTILRFRRHRR
jgi:hypothetical protein